MTQEEIIEMARQVGLAYNQSLCEVNTPFCDGVGIEDLERFFHMAQVAEREACAKMCEDMLTVERYERNIGLLGAAVAIRKRGQEC